MLDLAGREDMRHCWRRHAGWPDCPGIVFVVDAADTERIEAANSCLQQLPGHRSSDCTIPLLVFLNKHDLPGALSKEDATQALGLPDTALRHPFHIQPCSSHDATSLREGMVWLLDAMQAHAESQSAPEAAEAST